MSPVEIATIGAVIAVALAGIGLWSIVRNNVTIEREPPHKHTWSRWEVKSYTGRALGVGGTITIREQERTCVDCGYTQVEELP